MMAAMQALAKGVTLSEAILTELNPNSTEYPPVVEPKFSPLTHCALCGKMLPSIAASVRQQVPIQFTIDHPCYWDDALCDCLPLKEHDQ